MQFGIVASECMTHFTQETPSTMQLQIAGHATTAEQQRPHDSILIETICSSDNGSGQLLKIQQNAAAAWPTFI